MYLFTQVLCMLIAVVAAGAKRTPSTYAVPMKPVTQYSQRDPLYHVTNQSHHHRRTYPPYQEPYYHPYSYPEPIIEIIIKESNQTLPPPTTPPPRPPTKEPIHVFYVKYKKNPNPKGDHDKVIYEKPVAALTTHQGEETNHAQPEQREAPAPVYTVAPPSTTLRTIIRPDSEIYHSSGPIHVTFGDEEREHHEQKEGSEQQPQLALPDGRVRFPERLPPPTPQQIRSYQQQKQFLYEQSLRQQQQQQQASGLTIIPANRPRQFQQPNKNRLSNLQISFQQQQRQQQQQQQQQHQQQHQQPQGELTDSSQYFSSQINNGFQPSPSPQPIETSIQITTPPPVNFIQDENNHQQHKPEPPRYSPLQDYSNHANTYQRDQTFKTGNSYHSEQSRKNVSPYNREQSLNDGNSYQPDKTFNDENSYQREQTFKDGEIIKSISQSEEHQIEHNFAHHHFQPQPTQEVRITPQPIYYPTYKTTTNRPEIHYTTTKAPVVSTAAPTESSEEFKPKLNKTALNSNLAALPDEVPADLREQLLSSGILSNADISILDYDKVGDIPIDQLPPEALEQFYGAASEPAAALAAAPFPVQMKVVRYDPRTDHGQAIASSYIRPGATALHPVVLNDNKYNRYLPLKVNGTEFPVPEGGQLAGRIIKSVVVLTPVEYEGQTAGDDRLGRAVHVRAIRGGATPRLAALVRHPSKEHFTQWLEHEKTLPPPDQSVVLLVAQSPEGSEIFMYDTNTDKASRLRGELSRTFVEVAESNSSSQDLDGLKPSNK